MTDGGSSDTVASEQRPSTYRLAIMLPRRLEIEVGRLGHCVFPAGRYAYVGSARRNMEARLRRHLGTGRERLHWHIDYLLTQPGVRIVAVETFVAAECALVAATAGRGVVPGFGASDCRAGCGSHLRYFGRGKP